MSLIWLFAARVGRLHVVPTVRGDEPAGLRVLRGEPTTSTTTSTSWTRASCFEVLPQHGDHRGPGRHAGALPGLDDGLRRVALQLAVQPLPADAVHRRQPAPAAGHHHAALPDVPGPPAAAVPERQRRLLRPVLRHHGDPRRLPARVLHVRPEQLHEDPAERAERSGASSTARRCLADVLAASSCHSPDRRWRPSRRSR